MQTTRVDHSSCQLAGHIYVFCGVNSDDERINSVEKLSIDADPNLQISKQWEVIPKANLTALPKLYKHLCVALNDFEIIILGGGG